MFSGSLNFSISSSGTPYAPRRPPMVSGSFSCTLLAIPSMGVPV